MSQVTLQTLKNLKIGDVIGDGLRFGLPSFPEGIIVMDNLSWFMIDGSKMISSQTGKTYQSGTIVYVGKDIFGRYVFNYDNSGLFGAFSINFKG